MNSELSNPIAVFLKAEIAFKMTIKKCDIFTQKGLKVIHCPATYETDLRIIYKDSLIGQFMRKFENERSSIESQIAEFIAQPSQSSNKTWNQESGKYKFTPGIACPIDIDNEKYILSAFNEQTKKEQIKDLSLSDYIIYWENLWESLWNNLPSSRNLEVNVAVPGGNFVSVTAGPDYFNLRQKVGVIVHTFFRARHENKQFKKLNICLNGDEADTFGYLDWQESILPYLWEMSRLPIYMQVKVKTITPPPPPPIGYFEQLIEDLKRIAGNIDNANNSTIVQKVGRQKPKPEIIKVDTSVLKKIIDHLGDDSDVRRHFDKGKNGSYDPNSLFEILGILVDEKLVNLFGKLIKKSIVRVCLDYRTMENDEFILANDAELPAADHWKKLGPRIDNISRKFEPACKEIMKPKYKLIFDYILSLINSNNASGDHTNDPI